jgi:hypothetical protein
MTNIVMASDAVKLLIVDYAMRRNLARKILVTVQAIGIQHARIGRLYANGFSKIPERKCHRMMVAIAGLCQPFMEKIVRHMTVIACGESVVAGFLPAVKFIAHDVAVHTCLRIIRKIGCAARIIKCVSSGAQQDPQQRTKQQPHSLPLTIR